MPKQGASNTHDFTPSACWAVADSAARATSPSSMKSGGVAVPEDVRRFPARRVPIVTFEVVVLAVGIELQGLAQSDIIGTQPLDLGAGAGVEWNLVTVIWLNVDAYPSGSHYFADL